MALKGEQAAGEQEIGRCNLLGAATQKARGAGRGFEGGGGDFTGQRFQELEGGSGHMTYSIYTISLAKLFLPPGLPKATLLPMGYTVKIQKVERPTNRSYYLNFPVALAEAIGLEKGEDFEWWIEDKNTLILKRSNPKPHRKFKSKRP